MQNPAVDPSTERVRIDGNMELYRRLRPADVKDGKVNSFAFKVGKINGRPPQYEYDQEISTEISTMATMDECIRRGGPPIGPPIYGLAGVEAEWVRMELGFNVCHEPLEGCYPHAQIMGNNTREKSRRLAEQMTVYRVPSSPPR
jgi:hypothetical protein